VKTTTRTARPNSLLFAALLVTLVLSMRGADKEAPSNPGDATALPPPSNGAISPQDQADALHFVIAADREVLCGMYLAHAPADAKPEGATTGGWPCPSVSLRTACESIQSLGAEFSYALRALSPMEPRNSPQTDLEQAGLAFVVSHPGQNYYGKEMLGGRRYFTAVYPDLPAGTRCVECHNRSSGTTPRLHKPGDPLGVVVVRVPLEF